MLCFSHNLVFSADMFFFLLAGNDEKEQDMTVWCIYVLF